MKRKVGRPPKDKALVAAKKAALEAAKREAKLQKKREFTKILELDEEFENAWKQVAKV